MINYYWPPSGGPAVQRWLAFTRYLRRWGYHARVLTVDPAYATYPLLDESLLEAVPETVEVARTPAFDFFAWYKNMTGRKEVPASGFANEHKPSWGQKLARFLRGNFFIPDPRRGWNPHALKHAQQLLNQHPEIGAVITTGPPHSTHLIGRRLKRQFPDRIWIADFHDAWTDIWYYRAFFHTPPARWLDRRLEYKVLQECDAFLAVSASLQSALLKKIKGPKKPASVVVTMGYDPALLEEQTASYPDNARFTLTYVGTMAVSYAPEGLWQAISEAADARPGLLRLRFVGILDSGTQAQLKAFGLDDLTEQLGYVSHARAISYMQQADALLIMNPLHDDRYGCIPGKLFEYLAARRPILGLAGPHSEVESIVTETRSGLVFQRHQHGAIRDQIVLWIDQWAKDGRPVLPFRDDIRRYARDRETEKIALLVRDLLKQQDRST